MLFFIIITPKATATTIYWALTTYQPLHWTLYTWPQFSQPPRLSPSQRQSPRPRQVKWLVQWCTVSKWPSRRGWRQLTANCYLTLPSHTQGKEGSASFEIIMFTTAYYPKREYAESLRPDGDSNPGAKQAHRPLWKYEKIFGLPSRRIQIHTSPQTKHQLNKSSCWYFSSVISAETAFFLGATIWARVWAAKEGQEGHVPNKHPI